MTRRNTSALLPIAQGQPSSSGFSEGFKTRLVGKIWPSPLLRGEKNPLQGARKRSRMLPFIALAASSRARWQASDSQDTGAGQGSRFSHERVTGFATESQSEHATAGDIKQRRLSEQIIFIEGDPEGIRGPVLPGLRNPLRRRKVLFLAGSMELTMRTRPSAGEDGANSSQCDSAALTIEPMLTEEAAGTTPTLTNGVDENCRECTR